MFDLLLPPGIKALIYWFLYGTTFLTERYFRTNTEDKHVTKATTFHEEYLKNLQRHRNS